MDYGIKISKEGHDVKDAKITDLLASSSFSLFKFDSLGSSSVFLPARGTTVAGVLSFPHGLLYIPAVFIYWSYDNINWQMIGEQNYMNVNNNIWVIGGADASNIYAYVFKKAPYGDTTVYLKWHICVDLGE